MIVVGLTGSIGMGKSTAAKLLKSLGIPVHDSDATVHKLLGPGGKAVEPVSKAFAEAARKTPGGMEIDRATLGKIVFADSRKLKELEEILHPLVRQDSDEWLKDMRKSGADIAVLDIPLLYETGAEDRVKYVICISAPEDMQRDRVMARPGMTEEKFKAILASQVPDAEKRKKADYVVLSDVSEEETLKALEKVMADIRRREGLKSGAKGAKPQSPKL